MGDRSSAGTRGPTTPWTERRSSPRRRGHTSRHPASAAGGRVTPIDRPLGAGPGRPARPDDRAAIAYAHARRHRSTRCSSALPAWGRWPASTASTSATASAPTTPPWTRSGRSSTASRWRRWRCSRSVQVGPSQPARRPAWSPSGRSPSVRDPRLPQRRPHACRAAARAQAARGRGRRRPGRPGDRAQGAAPAELRRSTWSASSTRTRCQLHEELQQCRCWARPTTWPRCSITHDIDHVVLAFTADHEAGLDVVRVCNELGVQVDIVPRLFEVVGSRAAVYSLEGTPLLGLTRRCWADAPPGQARHGRRRRDFGLVRALAALPRDRDRDQAERAGPGLLPPDPRSAAARSRSRSSSSARWSPTPRRARPRSRT